MSPYEELWILFWGLVSERLWKYLSPFILKSSLHSLDQVSDKGQMLLTLVAWGFWILLGMRGKLWMRGSSRRTFHFCFCGSKWIEASSGTSPEVLWCYCYVWICGRRWMWGKQLFLKNSWQHNTVLQYYKENQSAS